MEGGQPGGLGRNTWIKQARKEDGDLPEGMSPDSVEPRDINIGGKATLFMGKGDRLLIETPGGGGWGVEDVVQSKANCDCTPHVKTWEARGSLADRASAQAGF